MSNGASDGRLANLEDSLAKLVKGIGDFGAYCPTEDGQRRAQIMPSMLTKRSQLRRERFSCRVLWQPRQVVARLRLFIRKVGERRLVGLVP
jgi:hypothetical protein